MNNKVEINKKENSSVEIKFTVPAEQFAKMWDKGVRKVQAEVELPGFRKGHAPEDAIVSKYGEMVVLEEMANLVIEDTYLKAVIENKIAVIGQPRINITKIGKGSDLEYTALVDVYPEIEMPDYKAVAAKVSKPTAEEVTDADVEKVLNELAHARVPHTHDAEGNEVHDHGDIVIDDAFAQSFGENFKTLDDLKSKVKENMKLEKDSIANDKYRLEIMEELSKATKADLPKVIVDDELDRMILQIKADVERIGGKFQDYLAHVKKTEEEIREESRPTAVKRAMSQIMLAEIAKKENLMPNAEEIDVETIKVMQQIPNANEENAKAYVTQILMNEKVLNFLTGK